MSIVEEIVLMEAEGKIAETVNNEIKIDNFELQAKEKNIIKLKSDNCKIKFWFFFETTIDKNYLMQAYGELFNFLVKKEIIISKIDLGSFFTADFVYTLPKPFMDEKEFQKRMNDINDNDSELLKCYTIDTNALYDLLKNYKYNITDEAKRLGQMLGEFPEKPSKKEKENKNANALQIKGGYSRKRIKKIRRTRHRHRHRFKKLK